MAGRSIGRYQVLEELGAGGMGVVYRAHDDQLDRDIALKVLHPGALADETARARLIREARLASKLNHPNICTIHEVGETGDGQVYMAMELVEGVPLDDRLASGALPVAEVLQYGRQLADALAHAHERGVIHRDLKSANVAITPDGRAKVLDFGVARHLGGEDLAADTETRARSTLTAAGVITGTLPYMAPEQLRGEPATALSDIWALGIVLYEMAGGRRPFKGKTGFELTSAILHDPVPALPGTIPEEFRAVVARSLAKDPAARYQSAAEVRSALDRLLAPAQGPLAMLARGLRALRKPRVAVPAAVLLVAIAMGATWLLRHQARVRWAREQALPQIERLIAENDVWRDFTPAYRLAQQAEAIIPNDQTLARLLAQCSLKMDVRTEPAGARVSFKEYGAPDSPWTELGVSPLAKIRVPIGIFRWKFEKDGYDTVLAASATWDVDVAAHDVIKPYALERTLEKAGQAPAGMVRVDEAQLGRFYIDRCEVTNKQYKEFVNQGGYRNRAYWKQPFLTDGRQLGWEEAVGRFVDQTGQPGPATWQAGDYPEGQADYPVAGVSWYEAAAFAEFAGKSLPTVTHWGRARGEGTPLIAAPQLGGNAVFAPFSNFGGKGPVAVGSRPGITAFGALDMGGNVREWCWNETPQGRLIRGGAWDDNLYMFGNRAQAPPMDRSSRNGFRCALYPDRAKIPPQAFAPVQPGRTRDFYSEKPVPDQVYKVYREQFAYDPTDLRARVESREQSPGGWVREKVSFDAAYGSERVAAYLFLPATARPPYQAVVYVPGSASLSQRSSQDIETYYEFPMFLSFIVKSGRAALYPVYKGTFERSDPELRRIHGGAATHRYTEFLVQLVKDFRRSVDYLETRRDIDGGKVAYYGMSWGGFLGSIIPAVEGRLRASVLIAGSFHAADQRPESNQMAYVTRVRTPTLMLNGKFDALRGGSIQPMFDLLGTPADQKVLKLYDTDHIPPRNEMIKETLAWLDRYLGPVR